MTSIALSVAAATLLANFAGSFLKGVVLPRFGETGVHAVVFLAALVAAWFMLYGRHVAGLGELLAAAAGIFSLAVAFYEVLLKRLSLFKEGF